MISVALPREQVQAIYELTVARAVTLEGTEAYMGPHTPREVSQDARRYREAANELAAALSCQQPPSALGEPQEPAA